MPKSYVPEHLTISCSRVTIHDCWVYNIHVSAVISWVNTNLSSSGIFSFFQWATSKSSILVAASPVNNWPLRQETLKLFQYITLEQVQELTLDLRAGGYLEVISLEYFIWSVPNSPQYWHGSHLGTHTTRKHPNHMPTMQGCPFIFHYESKGGGGIPNVRNFRFFWL